MHFQQRYRHGITYNAVFLSLLKLGGSCVEKPPTPWSWLVEK